VELLTHRRVKRQNFKENTSNVRSNKTIPMEGKDHNETLEIFHPLEHTTAATDAFDVHAPENGGT
jgi:hypothetical protein